MLYILVEPVYKESMWCNEITEGIVGCAKLKRIPYCFAEETDEFFEGQVILVATSLSYIKEMTEKLNHFPVNIIVATPKPKEEISASCSFVGFDSKNAILDILNNYLYDCREKTALFGVNVNSVNDLSKKHCFINGGGNENNIFYNNGNIKECTQDFLKAFHRIEAILCTNCYVAFYLVQRLKNEGVDINKLNIISLSDSSLLTLCKSQISAVGIDYHALGKSAFQASRLLSKNSDIHEVNMSVKWKLNIRNGYMSNKKEVNCSKTDLSAVSVQDFYGDSELIPLMNIERLFEVCDNNDLKLILMLKKGFTYNKICESLFISESGLKYRIKKIMMLSGATSRKQLIDLLEHFDIEIT